MAPNTAGGGTGRLTRARSVAPGTRSIRSEVIAQFEQVSKEQDKPLAPLVDGLALLDSGLDSLCLAIIVARLEDVLDMDPFSSEAESGFPVTVGDFIEFYENAAK